MQGGKRSATVRVATWSARHPWRAILGWLLFVAACVAAGAGVGTNKGEIEDFWIGDAGRAEAIADAGGLTPAPVEQVLVTSPSGPLDTSALDTTAADAAARDVVERMRTHPDVADVSDPVRSADGTAIRVEVTLTGDADTAKRSIDTLLARTAAVQAQHPDLTITQTGGASISVGVDEKLGQDLARTELVSLPITVLILFLVFGAILAAGVPVLLALSAIAGSVGLYGLASWVFPDAGGAVLSVVFLLGMAVGVDYSLFYLKRVREERAAGAAIGHAEAVELAAATSGRAIWFSGLAVVLSLAGLYLVGDVIFASIATGAILVVAVAMASSLTVLPALLVTLGRRADGRWTRARWRQARRGSVWATLLRPAMRRPVVTLLVGVALTAAVALPATAMRLGNEGKETFPTSVPAVATYERLTGAFPTEGVAHLVAVRSDPAGAARVAAALDALVERTRGDARYAPDAQIRTSADTTTSTVRIAVPYPENSSEARASLDHLRGTLVPETLGRVPGAEYAVTGEVARGVDYSAHQAERIPWVIGFVALATLLVMFFALGSPVLAALGVLLNLASVACAWGVLTLVFQGRWAEDLLGFTSTGFIGSRTPLLVFAILVGLSTDYQIFVVSRIREAVQRGVPTRHAVRDGIAGSASVVTSAAAIMISVFVSFVLIDRIELKQVGVALTAAVLFDAVVLRILILPAAMTLLGERCWWPARPLRRTPAQPSTAAAATSTV